MKKILLTAVLALSLGGVAHAGSIRVQNGDSSTHTVKLKCSGTSKSFDIRGSTTATYTFHSTNSSCDIVGGSIDFPTSKLQNGQKWKIRSGKAVAY